MVTFLSTRRAAQALPPASRRSLAALSVVLLSACGGGGQDPVAEAASVASPARASALGAPQNLPTRTEAFRLLTQASFGPTEASLSQVSTLGLSGWVEQQLALPPVPAHRTRWLAATKVVKAGNPNLTAGPDEVSNSFYQQALLADDQLRQRVAFALSEIFVVSLNVLNGERSEAAADFHDMLGRNAFGNFRTLLQDVAMHPAMGIYLSHVKNRKADNYGRVPDQNFAREVMQLFSIGLHELNADGSLKLDASGRSIDTYDASDIEGLSAVFTGFSYGGADTSNQRFYNQVGYRDVNRHARPMQGYPQFHAMTPKQFLDVTIATQTVANPQASLAVALDRLYQHPNVGPFIGRQLIQRLVTSAPTPAYVARVSAVFNNNGSGVRGDMKAVIRAILNDTEARSATAAAAPAYGKLREPVLRLTAFLRAFKAKSDSGKVQMTVTDDPATALGQSPLRSPGVFNFFRPGYIPDGGEAAALGLTLPEMQITSESSVAGYANYMMGVVSKGAGLRVTTPAGTRPDLQPDYSAEMLLADKPADLVQSVLNRLLPSTAPVALSSEITAAVSSITIPALNKTGSNTKAIETAKRNRVHTAVLLAVVSPEFVVQK